jgi:mRNA degradation ribonuclease J1/J2
MVEAAQKEGIEAVITEGTRVNEQKGNTENDVFDRVCARSFRDFPIK